MIQGEADLVSSGPQPNSEWIRTFGSASPARLRLVCFPHAGGAASFFRDWSGRLPAHAELWAVQYPGRENRITEPFITDMHSLAERVTDELTRFLDLPTVIFGHSMGAAVGYEVVRRLTTAGKQDAIRHLVVSGCAAPHRVRAFPGQEGAHLLDDDQLVAMLGRLGFDSAELLADPDMRSVFLPAIRSDYRLIQSYTGRLGPVLGTNVTAFMARQDDAVSTDDLLAWSEVTRGFFELRSLPGGHFYLAHHRDEVMQALNGVLNAVG
jgi:pyochelin biosynthesis protein PchC